MKAIIKAHLIIFVFFAAFSSCDQTKSDLTYIDVTKNYPEKEIILSDIADVDYLYLNSDNDDFLYNGTICCVTENSIVVYDYSNGSILFFSKDGTPKSRFNHKGQGPEEYLNARSIIFDETADDVFVNNMRFIQVYSSTGQYKRKITLPQGVIVDAIVPFDEHSLFFYDLGIEVKRLSGEADSSEENSATPYYRISKTDGEILDTVKIPYVPLFLGINVNGQQIPGRTKRLLKAPDGVLLCSPETDTIFLYSHSKFLTPMIYKTPSVNVTDPMTYLNNCLDRGHYQFIEVCTVRAGDKYPNAFPVTNFMRDKKTGEVIRPKFVLPDYKDKEFIITPGSVSDDGYLLELDIIELKQAYYENKLNGKLKELAAALDEDRDNNVFALINFYK